MTYEQAIAKTGLNHEQVWKLMGQMGDPKPYGEDFAHIYPLFSPIHGIGLAASLKKRAGETVMPFTISDERYMGARYINHSDNPNSVAMIKNNDLYIYALENIPADVEITMCYYDNYCKSMELLGRSS